MVVDDKTPQHEYENKHCPHCQKSTRMVRVVGDDQCLCTQCRRVLQDNDPPALKETKQNV